MSSETELLLSFPSNKHKVQERLFSCFRLVCLPSKAALLILFWTVGFGILYEAVIMIAALIINSSPGIYYSIPDTSNATFSSLPYAFLAAVMMLYPLSGFMADVYCGRFKVVIASLLFLMLSTLFSTTLCAVIMLSSISGRISFTTVAVGIIGLFSTLFFIVGLVGYHANFIQFGLDQLLEAPSEYLGLFIHWTKWAYSLASVAKVMLLLYITCNKILDSVKEQTKTAFTFMIIYTVLLASLLSFSYWKRHWFYRQSRQHNPYKTVFRVLRFTYKHQYPLQRSAFTYSDNVYLSRINYAKEIFGGPFTTEQVEDTKTLLRIVLVLLALGPVHVLQVPMSSFVLPIFGLHIGHYIKHQFKCNGQFILQVGSLIPAWSAVSFPFYIWVIYFVLRKRIPAMFVRLGVGISIFLLGVFSMLVIDTVGHSLHPINDTSTSQCLFYATTHEGEVHYPALNMHWSVLITPNVLLGFGPLLVEATTMEFISAQAPNSMIGLLVGIYFAVSGCFQLLSSVVIIPLSLKQPWMKEHPSFVSCGFIYFLVICLVGLTGLVLFSVAARKYKYRERNEVTFRQRDVEEIYDRYLTQAATAAQIESYESVDD